MRTIETKLKMFTPERAAKISATLKARGIRPDPETSKATQFKKGMKMPRWIVEKRAATMRGSSRPRQSELLRGANCHFWRGGLTSKNAKIRNSYESKMWRKAVLIRDNYSCQECGQIGGTLHIDHIKPFAFFPELRFDIENGRVLCIACHKKTDSYLSGAFKYAKV